MVVVGVELPVQSDHFPKAIDRLLFESIISMGIISRKKEAVGRGERWERQTIQFNMTPS